MKQLTQNLKTGDMAILEEPLPALGKGQVLVRNHYSVISAGTESRTVKDARAGYLGKAKSRPNELKKVVSAIKTNGVGPTYKAVMNRLDMPSPLGYSCAGEVIAVGEQVREFKVGDSVACGGNGAVHSEVVSVPKNLCAKVPDGVDLKFAAFSCIAAIALQGIRQADLRLGETSVVIGLGLIGQLTLQLLNAAGVHTIGIDIDPRQVELAEEIGVTLALCRDQVGLTQIISDRTKGYGADAVIITAGTTSLDPVELAGELCRHKGKVVIVGGVPTGFSRANYYRKELDLRMSCSYGPGRYDPFYEEKGVDYPIGYVRWTENRNMQAFLDLLRDRKVNLESLITHTFNFEKAENAYALILNDRERYLGVVLKYDVQGVPSKVVHIANGKQFSTTDVNVGFIGAGSFAQNYLLPNVVKNGNMIAVATARSNNARYIADKYHFQYCTGNADEIIADENIDTVFIATRHNSHAEYVIKALKRNKNVFVEKPLCMNLEELDAIKDEYSKRNVHLMVGFNRRFAPLIRKIRADFSNVEPSAINYRINAGSVPPNHWIHDKEIGGGRIIGEVCHFVDLAMFLANAKIRSVCANVLEEPHHLLDTLVINLGFANGSIASISYFSNGNSKLKKEHLEIFSAGQVAVVEDFAAMRVYNHKVSRSKLMRQDKGHRAEIRGFLTAIREGLPTPVPFEEIYLTTFTTFKILESIRTRQTICLAV